MGVSLSKGGNVSLAKSGIQQAAQAATDAGDHDAAASLNQLASTGLVNAIVGLGWDARTTTGTDFDLDASAIAVNTDGKVVSDGHFVFFNNLKSSDGSIEHLGDNLTGLGEGDDEQVKVHLGNVPPEVEKIVFPVSIYDGDQRGQNFGQVRNAFIRVFDADSGAEVARYDLSEDAATETAMVFGELYRNGADWKFRAVGQGYSSGLRGIAADFGVNL